MGSERHYPEEAPLRRVKVDSFWIDEAPVTNREFARFVAATGHRTLAEIAPDPKQYPGMLAGMDQPGSLVFNKTAGPVPLDQYQHWWSFTFGADWRHPYGPDATIDELGLWDHPVVHVAWSDAAAFADWVGKALPTEAEHEFAARGGLEGCDFAWGDELAPGGEMMANYWQGLFPFANTREDGWERTSPVGSFPANGYGLYDMIGNVWELTRDPFHLHGQADTAGPRRSARQRVIKGGSFLCSPDYCMRYRPGSRQPQDEDLGTSHVGFRTVLRAPGPTSGGAS